MTKTLIVAKTYDQFCVAARFCEVSIRDPNFIYVSDARKLLGVRPEHGDYIDFFQGWRERKNADEILDCLCSLGWISDREHPESALIIKTETQTVVYPTLWQWIKNKCRSMGNDK